MTYPLLKSRSVLAVSLTALSVGMASSAAAQQQRSEPVLEEIIVTADRPDSFGADFVQAGSFRGARQIDTPLTVSVMPEELLKSQQAQSLLDALRNTPGVTASQVSTTVYTNIDIRGISVDNRGNYRLNGSLPIINLIDLPLENKARVEALKGASALYYGFTTPSGIINLTTKRPPKDPLFNVNAFANSHGTAGGHIDAGNTYGAFGARVNLVYADVDSGIDNTRGYRNFQSGAFQLDATDTIQFNVDVEHIFKRITEPTVLQVSTATTSLPQLVDLKTNPGSTLFANTAEETNILGRVSWDISPQWNIILEAGQSKASRDRNFTRLANFDPVTGNGRLTLSAARGQQYRNNNYRVEMAGTFATGPVVHELLFGASQNQRRQYSPSSIGLAAANCQALGLPSNCTQNYYTPVVLNDTLGNFNATVPYNPARDTGINDKGLYIFDRMKFGGDQGDLISVLVGARKSFYKETSVSAGTTYEDNPFSLSGGLVVKPQAWVSLYATYIEGLESTPQAPFTAVNGGVILPASQSKQYEGGIKIEPKAGLLLTAAYFDIERELTYTNAANVFVKDGKATYRGVELSATGEVTPDLSLYASALLLRAKQGETSDVTLIGNRIENTAKATWSAFAEYRLSSLLPGLAISAGAYHVGDRAINPQNTLFIPGYTLFDLGGSFTTKIADREVVFRVNAENIGGKRYFSSTAGNYISYGAPPTVKFSVGWNFF